MWCHLAFNFLVTSAAFLLQTSYIKDPCRRRSRSRWGRPNPAMPLRRRDEWLISNDSIPAGRCWRKTGGDHSPPNLWIVQAVQFGMGIFVDFRVPSLLPARCVRMAWRTWRLGWNWDEVWLHKHIKTGTARKSNGGSTRSWKAVKVALYATRFLRRWRVGRAALWFPGRWNLAFHSELCGPGVSCTWRLHAMSKSITACCQWDVLEHALMVALQEKTLTSTSDDGSCAGKMSQRGEIQPAFLWKELSCRFSQDWIKIHPNIAMDIDGCNVVDGLRNHPHMEVSLGESHNGLRWTNRMAPWGPVWALRVAGLPSCEFLGLDDIDLHSTFSRRIALREVRCEEMATNTH